MPSSWNASLDLRYEAADGRTVVARRHHGPLQVQKALYPEGDRVCHSIIVHPPGGIAGGDALAIRARCLPAAHALLTTPGATRWYKADGRRATQSIRLDIDGALEWLPQETIVFDRALVESTIELTLRGAACSIGWDVIALGRTASGETFRDGEFVQTIRLTADDELLWCERTRVTGGDPLLHSPVGLGGNPVFGCLWAYGPEWADADIDSMRSELPAPAAVTRLAPRLLLARALGASTSIVRHTLQTLWRLARPRVFGGRECIAPRIWAT